MRERNICASFVCYPRPIRRFNARYLVKFKLPQEISQGTCVKLVSIEGTALIEVPKGKHIISKAPPPTPAIQPDMQYPAASPTWNSTSTKAEIEHPIQETIPSVEGEALDTAFFSPSKAHRSPTASDVSEFASPWADHMQEALPAPAELEMSCTAQAFNVPDTPAEEDEWGDMISSHTPALTPNLNAAQPISQSCTPSLGASSRPCTASATLRPRVNTFQTASQHKPFVSFDQILSPISNDTSIPEVVPEAMQPSLQQSIVSATSVDVDQVLFPKSTSPRDSSPLPTSARPATGRIRAPSVTFDQILGSPASYPRPQASASSPFSSTQSPTPSVSFDEILGSTQSTANTNITPSQASSPLRNAVTASSISPSASSYYQAPSVTVQTHDRWASVNFSLLETTEPIVSQATPALEPVKSTNAQSIEEKKEFKTKEEVEQDMVVERILRNLPDLGYMLRR